MSQVTSQVMNENEWKAKLSKYIEIIIGKIISSQTLKSKVKGSEDTVLSRFIDNKAMAIWSKAFTHESVNANPGTNYEALEYYGDRMLKAMFARYVREQYPDYTQSQYNEIDRINMSKNRQGKLAEELKLIDHVRVNSDLKYGGFAIGSDVFESFTGALVEISDSIMPNFGFVTCAGFIKYLFGEERKTSRLQVTNISGDPKTLYVQIFRQLDIDKNDVPNSEETGSRFKLRLSNIMINRINDILARSIKTGEKQRSVESDVIAYIDNKSNMSDKTVKHELYQLALNNLQSLYCIDQGYAKNYKNYMDRFKIDQQGLLQPLENKFVTSKLTDLYFKQPTKSTNKEKINFVQLIAKDPQGVLHILGNGSGNTLDEAMINSVKNYLNIS